MRKFLRRIANWFDDLLVPRELVTVTFQYDEQYARHNPVRKAHVVLARVRRTASPKEVQQGLFSLKPPNPKTTIRVIDIKILPITKLPRV